MIEACNQVLAEVGRATVRQLFYQLVVMGILKNTKNQYTYLSKVLTKARKDGLVYWTQIVDATREPQGNYMVEDLKSYIERLPSYKQWIWNNQKYYIEIWLEKEALSRIVMDALEEWDNRIWIQPMRGYTSYTCKKKAENRFYDHDNIILLIFSDFDPSGKDLARDVRQFFEESGTNVECVRIALTRKQVDKYNLPEFPAKKSDPRTAKDPDKIQVELDALRPDILKQIVQNAVKKFINQKEYDKTVESEKEIQKKIDDVLNGINQ